MNATDRTSSRIQTVFRKICGIFANIAAGCQNKFVPYHIVKDLRIKAYIKSCHNLEQVHEIYKNEIRKPINSS